MSNDQIDHLLQLWIIVTIFIGIPCLIEMIVEIFNKLTNRKGDQND